MSGILMKNLVAQFHVLHVNEKTNWSFVEVRTQDGHVGVGECSLNGWEPLLHAAFTQYAPQVESASFQSLADIAQVCRCVPHHPGGVVVSAIRSAFEQALTDAFARSQGVPVWALFADTPVRRAVEVYANINRGTQPRTPQGFAASAQRAVAQGFRSVKCAPFDGVFPDTCGAQWTLIEAGIARVAAIKSAVAPEVKVMVDCHWRFDEATATRVLDRLAEAGIAWFECPVSEANHDAIYRLRQRANAKGILLAGAEMLIEVEGFAAIFARGLYDVVMPDVKYCGGVAPLLRIAAAAQRAGLRCAPHNPTGPICNMASVHACVAHEALDWLEHQLGESQLFTECVQGGHPTVTNGTFAPLATPGFGLATSPQVFAAHSYQSVPPGLDERLG
jgi:galactonate dehydratase